MIAFWFTAALLLLVAYALFIPALRGKFNQRGVDRQQLNLLLHRQRREDLARELTQEDVEILDQELDKDLLTDLSAVEKAAVTTRSADAGKISLILALVAAPLVGGVAYSQLGRPDLADFKPEARAAAAGNAEGQVPGDFNTMIDRLAERLRNEPENLQGWMLLARSYHETRQFDKAIEAYEKVLAKAPDNLDAKGYYAESLGEVAGSFRGKPLELANEIVQLAPKNHNALWILGAAAAESGDANKAGGYFKKLRAEFPKDSEDYKHLTQIIAQVGGTDAAEPEGGREAPPAGASKAVRVKVSLAPALKKKAGADDTVFIFAKAASGPPMPLAIARKNVKDLPVEVTLDDSMAMTAGMSLSSFEQVVIGARISKTGNALPAAGDLQGLNAPVAAKNGKTYTVQIDKEVEQGAVAAAPPPPAAEPSESAGDGTAIKVRVSLAGSVKAKAAADDTVFIFAKASAGPPMPLAIVRKQVKDLPVEVTLDDSMAMMPGKNLSSAPQVIIGARVSKSGNALPAPGDLQGMTSPTLAENGQSYSVEIASEVQ